MDEKTQRGEAFIRKLRAEIAEIEAQYSEPELSHLRTPLLQWIADIQKKIYLSQRRAWRKAKEKEWGDDD